MNNVALLTKTERNNEGDITFLQNNPHCSQYTYSNEFYIGRIIS